MKRDHNGLSIVEKGYFSRQFFILSRTKIPIFINSLLMVGGMLIGAEGTSLSAGVPGSLLCALAPAPYSRRSLRTFRSNQQTY
jgi:hypothetical protein